MKRSNALVSVVAVYLAAGSIAYLVFTRLDPALSGLLRMLIADTAATLVVFLASVIFNNSSIYDPYWSAAPPVMLFGWMLTTPGGFGIRQGVLLLVVSAWSIRLTCNWASGWRGMDHEDWRYRGFRKRFGKLYWPVSLAAVHLFPTVVVFAALAPSYALIQSPGPFGVEHAAGALIILAGTLLSFTADNQMRSFKKDGRPDQVMASGLWALSRHPNYLGELLVWFGIWVYAAGDAPIYSAAGLMCMILLFNGYSIPVMEKKILETRSSYAEIQRQVPRLMIRRLPAPNNRASAKK
jgi:steroid 5-alpha reductase family enzyme